MAPGTPLRLPLLIFGALLACSSSTPDDRVVFPELPEILEPAVFELIDRLAVQARARPWEASAHGELGLAYEANLFWDKAAACFRTAARLEPDGVSWQLHLAIVQGEMGDFDGALETLRELSENSQESAPVLHRLGHALLDIGDLEGAESAFRRLKALAPESVEALAGLGDVLLQRREYEEAVEILVEAVALAPRYRPAHYILGRAYRGLGRETEAKRELTLGANSKVNYLPDLLAGRVREYQVNSTARLARSDDLLRAGQPAQAAAILEELLERQTVNVTVLNNLAIAYMRLGRTGEAQEVLEKAVKRDGGKFSTYLNLASLARSTEHFDQALEYSDVAVQKAPRISRTHYARAQALAELGRYDEATEALSESMKIDPHRPQIHTFMGDLALRLDRWTVSGEHYRAALDLDPRFLPAWIGLARVGIASGRASDVTKALAAIREHAPGHPALGELRLALERRRQSKP